MKLPPLVNSPFWPVFTVIFYPQPWKQWYVLDFSLGWWVGLLQNVLCVRNTIWKWRTFGCFSFFLCVCLFSPQPFCTLWVLLLLCRSSSRDIYTSMLNRLASTHLAFYVLFFFSAYLRMSEPPAFFPLNFHHLYPSTGELILTSSFSGFLFNLNLIWGTDAKMRNTEKSWFGLKWI